MRERFTRRLENCEERGMGEKETIKIAVKLNIFGRLGENKVNVEKSSTISQPETCITKSKLKEKI